MNVCVSDSGLIALTIASDCYFGTTYATVAAFTQMFQFACLNSSKAGYCMSAIGPLLVSMADGGAADDDSSDDDAAPLAPPTLRQCAVARDSGCCFASLMAYGVSAVQADYLKLAELTAFQNFPTDCQTQYNITLHEHPCNGTQPSTCQTIMNELSPHCLQFMMSLNDDINNITTSEQNVAVCNNSCFANVSAALSILVANGLTCFLWLVVD